MDLPTCVDIGCKLPASAISGPVPSTLLPAKAGGQSGCGWSNPAIIRHPVDGALGIAVLTDAGHVCHFAAGVMRTLPPDAAREIASAEYLRLAGTYNCSGIKDDLYDRMMRWQAAACA